MLVTVTEFISDIDRYLELVKNENIYLTENGKTIAKISNPNVSAVDALAGILQGKVPDDFDRKDLRAERLSRYMLDG